MKYIAVTSDDFLAHHGVKGQKWGVRRYQNEDGSYKPGAEGRYDPETINKKTDKAGREYEKASKKIHSKQAEEKRSLKAYNNAAERMNEGLIKEYNSEYDKKLGEKAKGHDYFNDKKYIEGYEKLFEKVFNEEYNKLYSDEVKNNKNIKKAEKIVSKYGIKNYDSISRGVYKSGVGGK